MPCRLAKEVKEAKEAKEAKASLNYWNEEKAKTLPSLVVGGLVSISCVCCHHDWLIVCCKFDSHGLFESLSSTVRQKTRFLLSDVEERNTSLFFRFLRYLLAFLAFLKRSVPSLFSPFLLFLPDVAANCRSQISHKLHIAAHSLFLLCWRR